MKYILFCDKGDLLAEPLSLTKIDKNLCWTICGVLTIILSTHKKDIEMKNDSRVDFESFQNHKSFVR
jgi:hypothetical protein